MFSKETFSVTYYCNSVRIDAFELHNRGLTRRYYIARPQNSQAFYLYLYTDQTGRNLWCSIPGGNTKLAEDLGWLIEQHYEGLNTY